MYCKFCLTNTAKKTGSWLRDNNKARHYYRCDLCGERWATVPAASTKHLQSSITLAASFPWDSLTWELDINEPHEGEE